MWNLGASTGIGIFGSSISAYVPSIRVKAVRFDVERELSSNVPASIGFTVIGDDGIPWTDSDVTSLSYSIENLSEGVEQVADTVISPANASGDILLSAADLALQGSGSRELLRLCLLVNGSYPSSVIFYILEGACS